MTVMAPIRPTQQPSSTRDHRAALPADPTSVAEARRQVTAAVRYWRVPVDIEVAALLVSELVTNAIRHDGRHCGRAAAEMVRLTIQSAEGHLRVDVHDTSPALPVLNSGGVPASAESGRGLVLVDALAATWGCYRTSTGKAVYFTL